MAPPEERIKALGAELARVKAPVKVKATPHGHAA